MRGIHSKLIATLVLASLIPLLIGLGSLYHFGRKSFLDQKGALFQLTTDFTARELSQGLHAHAESFSDWTILSALGPRLAAFNEFLPDAFGPTEIDRMEQQWASANVESDLVRPVLNNDLSEILRQFTILQPLEKEILVTDRIGRMVAGTNKSSDFWQADEMWWQQASKLPRGGAWVEGIEFDQSAKIYAISVSAPLFSDAGFEGVVKGVIDASPLIRSLAVKQRRSADIRQVVYADGSLLANLNKTDGPSSLPFALPSNLVSQWTIASGEDGTDILAGITHVDFSWETDDIRSDLATLYVVSHQTLHTILAPVGKQLRYAAILGLGIIVFFGLAGYHIAHRNIVHPINVLRSTTHDIADASRQSSDSFRIGAAERHQLSQKHLNDLATIRTGDELEVLADDFRLMAERVLHYQDQMEQEIASKTEEIQQDLEMARQFQEALLPCSIPPVSFRKGPQEFMLNFSHIYKPALSVGGDFFDVHNLGDHTAGVFIADVMGHGARSALVTAILHTMLKEAEHTVKDPAVMLNAINERVYSLAQRTDETLFVTAFYLSVDTDTGYMKTASAGHPSPLLVSRINQTVTPLLREEDNGIALGLDPNPGYKCQIRPLMNGDTLVLFTDGVTEARNPQDEEYGEERLFLFLEAALREQWRGIPSRLMEELHAFMDTEPAHDDICVVTAEIQSIGDKKATIPSRS